MSESIADDLARIDLLSALAPEYADFLADLFDRACHPYQRRAMRLADRDAAVVAALAKYEGWLNWRACEALASELRNLTSTRFAAGDRADLLRKIIHLSGWKPIWASSIAKLTSRLNSDSSE